MSQVKLAAQFTKATQPYNGLTEDKHVAELIDEPHGRRYALIAYDVLRVSDEIKDGTQVPTVDLVWIEPVSGKEADDQAARMKELFKERNGREESEEPDPTLFDGVPEASGEEIVAELDERRAEREQGEG
jgi:hypothetical protein